MIYTADLVLPITGSPVEHGAILVKDGRVVTVGERASVLRENPREEFHDFGDALLMPGLVNLHSHFECAAFDFLASEPTSFSQWLGGIIQAGRGMERDDWLRAARKGVADSLAAGITCSADITRSGAGLQAAYEAGMPALIYLEVVAVDASNLMETVVGLLERLKSSEPVAQAGVQKLGLSPHSAYTLTEVALKACADIAQQYTLPLSIHLAETADEVELVRSGSGSLAQAISERLSLEVIAAGGSGSTPAEFLDGLGLVNNSLIAAHGVWLSEDDIVLMRQKGAAIAVCPTSNELLNVGEAPIRSFVERGISFGIGTDSIASNPSFDLFVEAGKVRAIYKKQGGTGRKLRSQALIEKLTIEAARTLGFDDDLGSIEAGKRADFIAIDMSAKRQTNPYNYLLESVTKNNITHTILGGEIVYENR
jgi:5-methylthioadenosine/S-adenosylhomocysteine deaminase